MKKRLVLFLCLLFCLSLAACGDAEPASQTQSPNGVAKAALTEVLNYEQTFAFKNMFERVTEETLDKFEFSLPYQSLYVFTPMAYVFTDRDADGIEELLVQDARNFCMLTLDYEDGKVTGTVKDHYDFRDYQDLAWVTIEQK